MTSDSTRVRRIPVDPDNPDVPSLEEAAKVIGAEGLLGLPTETFYALAANGLNQKTVNRILDVKGRSEGKPVGLLLANMDMAEMVAARIPKIGMNLMERFWPGPLSLILDAKEGLPAGVLGEGDGVSVRVPGSWLAIEVTRLAGVPLTATSANRTGTNPPQMAEEVIHALGGHLDLVLDAGGTPGGLPSTMVDVRKEKPILLREGPIPWEDIVACLSN